VAAFVMHALRMSGRPLLDLTLFREPSFAPAGVLVLLVGAALFGSLILIPLYLQIGRGESVPATGLLTAPQGVGAALAMPFSGRRTDQTGGGPVTLVGLLIMTTGTIALTRLTAHTPYTVTSAILVVRGVGPCCSMMPSMAAAYLGVTRSGPPRDHGPQRAAACPRLDRHGPARGRPRGSGRGGDRLGTKRSFNLGCWTARRFLRPQHRVPDPRQHVFQPGRIGLLARSRLSGLPHRPPPASSAALIPGR
jgi:hypothetical protein